MRERERERLRTTVLYVDGVSSVVYLYIQYLKKYIHIYIYLLFLIINWRTFSRNYKERRDEDEVKASVSFYERNYRMASGVFDTYDATKKTKKDIEKRILFWGEAYDTKEKKNSGAHNTRDTWLVGW